MLINEIIKEKISRKEAIEIVKEASSKNKITNLWLTGSLASKEEGNDIDIIWEPPQKLKLLKVLDDAFDLGFSISSKNKENASTSDFKVKCDIFIKLEGEHFNQWLKDKNIQSNYIDDSEDANDVKYLISTTGGGYAFANGYWKKQMKKGIKII